MIGGAAGWVRRSDEAAARSGDDWKGGSWWKLFSPDKRERESEGGKEREGKEPLHSPRRGLSSGKSSVAARWGGGGGGGRRTYHALLCSPCPRRLWSLEKDSTFLLFSLLFPFLLLSLLLSLENLDTFFHKQMAPL
jgi:hypothetical protein